MKKLTDRLSGKAYGMFNVKWLHVGSVTVFSIGSAVCGAAPNMNALIIGRVTAGAGGAGMYLGLLNLIAINTTARERPAYMGGTGVVWGTGIPSVQVSYLS
jgi:MFS family permease